MKRLAKQLFIVLMTAFLLVNYSICAYAEDTSALINEAVRLANLGEGWEAVELLHEAGNPELATAIQRIENRQ